ncbi:hypothetical protein [Ramlibacter sp. 2FC]|nr:hypothetical protein [Ramlibacter sp. 2FC]
MLSEQLDCAPVTVSITQTFADLVVEGALVKLMHDLFSNVEKHTTA